MKYKKISLVSFGLLFLLSPAAGKDTAGLDKIRIHIGPEPQSLDWHRANDGISATVAINIMEGLFGYDMSQDEIQLISKLADRFEHNKAYDKWTFWIKPGVKWSDGELLKAQQFVDSWKRLLAASTGSPNAHRLFLIKGAEDFHKGTIDFAKVGISINEDGAIEVRLNRSTPFFPQVLTSFFTFPIREDLIAKWGNQWSRPENMVCIGAYCSQSGGNSQELRLKANPHYYGQQPDFSEAVFVWMENKKTALRLFKQGKIDVVRAPEWTDVVPLGLEKSYSSVPSLGLYFLVFNFAKSPTNNVEFRRAVRNTIRSIDWSKLAGKDADVMHDFFPREILPPAKNKKRADIRPIKLVVGENFRIKVGSNSSNLNKKILEGIAFTLQKNLPVQVDVEMTDTASYFAKLQSDTELDLIRLSFTPSVLDPHGYAGLFTSSSMLNFGRYQNAAFDKLVLEAAAETNAKRRLDLYHEIEDILIDKDIVLVPLFKQRQSLLVNDKKLSLHPHRSERVELSYAKKAK